MTSINENKLNDELLDKVVGGSDDTKYKVGENVKFEVILYATGLSAKVEKIGTVIAINGNIYTIESKRGTYEVEEKDILHVAIENKKDGVGGGW